MTVRAAAQAVRARHTTPLALLEQSLTRIADTDPLLRAFVTVDESSVRADAARLTREAADGHLRGPLHGVPIAVKDVIDVRGLPTRGGSEVTDATPATADAPAVARLRAAGALIVGKTTTHELAQGVTTPPTRNPWDLQRVPGGSSGGSAAAVAAGQVPAALGSDTGGSIRVPAALCGVSGLRPPYGRVPVDGVLGFSPRLDTCGPVARDAADLAVLYEVLAATPCPVDVPARGLRVGTVAPRLLGEADTAVTEAVDAAVAVLAGAGAVVTAADVPPFPAWSAHRAAFVLSEFLGVQRRAGWYPQRRERYGAEVARYLAHAEALPDGAPARAVAELTVLEDRLRQALSRIDVLVLPTTVTTAPPADADDAVPGESGRAPVVERLMRLCGPFSWCHLPAVTVPCGTTPEGLPIGLQIAGTDVSTVLSVAVGYQNRTGHHLRQPAPLAGVG